MFGFDVLVESKENRKDVSFTLLLLDNASHKFWDSRGVLRYISDGDVRMRRNC